jgi:hypothetical protein
LHEETQNTKNPIAAAMLPTKNTFFIILSEKVYPALWALQSLPRLFGNGYVGFAIPCPCASMLAVRTQKKRDLTHLFVL